MFTEEFYNITDLSHDLTQRLVYGKPDVVNATDTQLHDILVSADGCGYSFDLKGVWLTKRRWDALIQQYVDPDQLAGWLRLIEDKLTGPRKRGVAFMRPNVVKTQVNATTGREWRRWGSCMVGFSYRARPKPVLTLHSRTTYLGYIAQVDLALCHVLAREIGARLNLEPDDIGFRWHLEAGQFHAFKSLAWFYQDPYDQRQLEAAVANPLLRKKMPTLWLARRTLDKLEQEDAEGKGYGEHNYNQMLRIRRRYHAEITEAGTTFAHGTSGKVSKRNTDAFTPLPSVPLKLLTLDAVHAREPTVPSTMTLADEGDE